MYVKETTTIIINNNNKINLYEDAFSFFILNSSSYLSITSGSFKIKNIIF